MILKWNKENIKVIEFLPSANFSPVRSHVTLLPGVNEVTDAEYENMKPHIAGEISRGEIVVVEVKTLTAPGKPQKTASSVTEMPVKKAAEMVAECVNGETLNLWLAKESRSEIRERIRDRLKELGLDEVKVDVDLEEAEKSESDKTESKKADAKKEKSESDKTE